MASKKAANELINFMQYDLSKRLGTLGRLDMMNAINTRIMKYHEDHPPEAGDLDAIRERSVALTQQGDVQSAQGDLAGALKSYRDSLGIAEKLAKQDPDNAGWQHDLAWSFRRVGQTLESQGKLTEALTAFQNFKETFERLTAKDSSNTDWQWNLAVGYSDIGDILKAQGNLTEALVVYEQFKDRMERLAKQDPGNAGWQRDLSISYGNVGNVQSAQGDLAGALKSYRDSLGIREKLAKQDPGNAEWQGELAWVYWQTGAAWAQVEPKSKNEAQAMVEKGRDILRQLKARTGLTANQQEWLDSIEADLRKMEEKE